MATNVAPPPPPLSGTSQGPLLANPLTLRVTSLRRPQLWLGGSHSIDCAEEGDILFAPLRNAAAFGDGALSGGAHPILTFPASVGKHFVGEYFRAYLSFRNSATYPLSRMFFRAELITPRNVRAVLFEGECAKLDALTNKDIKVETKDRLAEPGRYTFAVSASYTDVSYDPKRFAMNYHIVVDTAICEVSRRVTVLPAAPTSLSAAASSSEAPPVFGVNVVLKNVSDTPMILSQVRFITNDGYENLAINDGTAISPSQGSAGGAAAAAASTVTQFAAVYSGGGRDDLADAHMETGDARSYYFEVAQRQLLLKQSANSTFAAELGVVQWEWRRENGDGGVQVSDPFKMLQPRGVVPEMTLGVARMSPTPLQVGCPVTLTLRAVNHSSVKVGVSLNVNIEKLLPHCLYAGMGTRPMGAAEPRGGAVECDVTIVLLMLGLVPLQGCFELCDANDPIRVLWPTRPPAVPPSLSSAGAAPTAVVQASQPPAEPFPPVLCELYVEC